MGRSLYKLGPDQFVEWSSSVDAPVTYVMSRAEAAKVLGCHDCPGCRCRRWSDSAIDRADETGSSGYPLWGEPLHRSPEYLTSVNRAGQKGERLTLAAILRRYASREADANFELQPGDVIPWEDE